MKCISLSIQMWSGKPPKLITLSINLMSSLRASHWSAASGKTKSTPKKLIGPLKTDKSMDIKESTSISTSKNGKTKPLGGILLSKVMLKSTLKKSTLNLPSYLISKDKPDPLSKKWCSIWDKNNKVSQVQMNFKKRTKWINSWNHIQKWTSLNASLIDIV